MPLELFIALRYLLARRRQAFISVISFISIIGVAVGVMALIIALGLMTGLQGELRDRILGSTAHIYVLRSGGFTDYQGDVERISQVPGVVGAAPIITDIGLIQSDVAHAFLSIKGVDPVREPGVTDIGTAMLQGELRDIEGRSESGMRGVVLGRNLAEKLAVGVGDRVWLFSSQDGTPIPGAGLAPRRRPARVVGTYSLGLLEFDSAYAFISLEFAELLTGGNGPAQIQVKLADADRAPEVARAIEATLGREYVAEEWQKTNQPLFSALWLEKMGLSIAIGLIVAVAALNIVASLILLVMEKSRDIAILKTMGLSSQRVMKTFMTQGLIIGVLGTTAGGIGGLVMCWALDHYQLIHISMDVYGIAHVPFVVRPLDFLVVVASAVLICFVATLYPSRQASKLDPVQALRFE
jgi:lipoprotein-releasing system permease protein